MAKRLALIGVLLASVFVAAWLLFPLLFVEVDVTERPAEAVKQAPPVEVPLSYISIPLSYSIEDLRKIVREQLSDKALAGRTKVKLPNRDVQVTVEKNGPFAIWVKGDTLRIRLPIKFKLTGDVHTHGELTIFSRARFGIKEDWQPSVDVHSSFEWDWQPRVGFWPFRFRIGDRLNPYIQKALNQGNDEFRKRAEDSVHTRSLAETAWKRLNTPHQLAQMPPVWLTMQPQQFYLEPITSDETDIHLNSWLVSRISLVEGDVAAVQAIPPLPPLQHGVPDGKTFVIPYTHTQTYAELAATVGGVLIGKPIEVNGGTVTPASVQLYPSSEDVVLRVSYKGQAPNWWQSPQGTVYFSGTPAYDAHTHVLSLANFHMLAPNSNPQAFLSRWVTSSDAFTSAIAPSLKWDQSKPMDKARSDTAAYLNKTIPAAFDLWGTVREFELQNVTIGPKGLDTHYLAKGDMSILFVP